MEITQLAKVVLEDDEKEEEIEIHEEVEVQQKAPNFDDKEEADLKNGGFEEV